MSEHDETVYRTSPGRVGKLMTILVGLVVVGGVIFFSLGDYWILNFLPQDKLLLVSLMKKMLHLL